MSCFVLIFAFILCQTNVQAKQVVRVRGRPRQGSEQSLSSFSAVPAAAEAASASATTTTTSEAVSGECPEKEGLQVNQVILGFNCF